MKIKSLGQSILSWNWTKHLLYWIIMSAGTMSECVFLIASLWMSANSSVHSFVLLFASQKQTENLTSFAMVAYVWLPECIMGLACVTTYGHIKMAFYQKTWKCPSVVWSILFGIPTAIFVGISVYTLWNSSQVIDFKVNPFLISVRVLAGFSFAFIAFLYSQIGKEQEADRLASKDATMADLRKQYDLDVSALIDKSASIVDELARDKEASISQLKTKHQKDEEKLQQELFEANELTSRLKAQLSESESAKAQLANVVQKSSGDALQAYPQECRDWLLSGLKTAKVEDVAANSGISKRRVLAAIRSNKVQTSSRNHDLVMVASLVNWLETQLPNEDKDTATLPSLHLVNG